MYRARYFRRVAPEGLHADPYEARRSVLSAQADSREAEANLDFTTDPRADHLAAGRTGTPTPAEAHAAACRKLRQELIRLFNCVDITWQEKQVGLGKLAAAGSDLALLAKWARNVRRLVEARRQQPHGKAGYSVCPECAAAIGYNPESCGACYRAAQHHAA